MFPTPVKTFVHPHAVYKLEYPAHWDQVTEKEGESCGFGPHDRDNVGLWISIMPVSADTDQAPEVLPQLMEHAIEKSGAANIRRDPSLKHYGLVADMTQEGQGGHYWLVAGGDVILFASTQVPVAERDEWNPIFQKMMTTLQITRDEHLLMRKVANEVLARLREKHPDQEFEFDAENKIRGKNQVVYLGNVFRDVKASPQRREQIVKRFVDTLSQPDATAELGHETWEGARGQILPVLKPRDYIKPEGPTQHILTSEWLADVVICYVIHNKKMFRFVTAWDVDRWGTTTTALHDLAIENLSKLPWPREIVGARVRHSGHVIVVDTDDSLASSRLLHPDLHRLFSGPLGSPFRAGIPCRNRLVLFSNSRGLAKKIGRKLKKDHDASSYSITPQPFIVAADGIALAQEGE